MEKVYLQNSSEYALVDGQDFDLVKQYKWWATKFGKTLSPMTNLKVNGRWVSRRMHRLLLDTPRGMVIDHINHDALDNRRSNLRICTRQQNRHNSTKNINNKSGHKGVSWQPYKSNGYWRVRFTVDGKSRSFGLFKDLQDAIARYKEEAPKYYGEYTYKT